MAPRVDGASSRQRLWRLVRVGGLCLVLLVLLAGAGLTALYIKFDRNISQIDIDGALGHDRPADSPNGSMDILVLGSDSRAGTDGEYGRHSGARADTAMIVHLNEARDAATVVSIPRDTLVERPSCGGEPARKRTMFNEAYSVGGPVCAVKTVEKLTGVRMDHYLEVDFEGFSRLVDTLGGVEVTTTQAIRDEDSELDLAAGTHTLDGEQSLALVRTRKALSDGSDLGRIRLQHSFVRALARQVGGIGLFTDPRRLYDIADTATRSVTTDSGLGSAADLAGLARTLKGIDPESMTMLTMPVTFDPKDPNRVVAIERQATQVWSALRADRPVPGSATEGSAAEPRPSEREVIARE
ncbi:LCP family protein [Streptomyces millisiae]|uniref:LCP family protein n=1 Tax=Streptomyces millisiae TaxID=3075542 RepID=UPI00374E18FD